MLCYLDKTFCPFKDCKYFDTCERALTENIKKDAEKAGLPICQFVDTPDNKPECYEKK